MDIKSVKVDAKRGENGDWVDNIPGMGDLRLRVRSFNSTDYQAFMAREIALVPKERRVGGRPGAALTPDVREALIIRGLAEHILLGWENLTEGDQPVEFTKEMATNFLADPDYRVFRNAVEFAAEQVEQVKADAVEAVVGNS